MSRNFRMYTICIGIALVGVGFGLFTSRDAIAQSLKSWSTGEVLRATDLNANFTALKNGKVGSGVTLTNTDVASNAAIAHSKLATPALLPKAWAMLSASCDGTAVAGTACTIGDSSQVTSVTSNASSGQYRLNLAYTPANANFAVVVTSHNATAVCVVGNFATAAPHARIECYDYAGAAINNIAFSVLVMDS